MAKRRLRPWVKYSIGFLCGAVFSSIVIFNATKVEYKEVEVEYGDTACKLIEEYNTFKSCDDLLQDFYYANHFDLQGRNVDDLVDGEMVLVPIVTKRK